MHLITHSPDACNERLSVQGVQIYIAGGAHTEGDDIAAGSRSTFEGQIRGPEDHEQGTQAMQALFLPAGALQNVVDAVAIIQTS